MFGPLEAIKHLEDGRRVELFRDGLDPVEVFLGCGVMRLRTEASSAMTVSRITTGDNYRLIEDPPKPEKQYWVAKVETQSDGIPVFRRRETDASENDEWSLDCANHWGDFAGFVYRLPNGHEVYSSLPIYANPLDGNLFANEYQSSNWPLCAIVGVRFYGIPEVQK